MWTKKKKKKLEGFLAHCLTVAGQEENLYAKKNYDKYLSALKNSGLVSVEEKGQSAAADVGVGAEGGAGAMVLLGKMTCFFFLSIIIHLLHIFKIKRKKS